MFIVVLGFLLLAIAVVTIRYDIGKWFPTPLKEYSNSVRTGIAAFAAFLGVWALASTSYVYVAPNKIGHMKRIYGSELTQGHIIGIDNQKGKQARVLLPGFHFSPMITVFNDIEFMPMVTVPTGWYGRIVARDGAPLIDGQVMAEEWSDEPVTGDDKDTRPIAERMLDAEYFLTHGGQRGLQTSVLKPGTYAINLYLFEVRIGLDDGKDHLYDENGFQLVDSPLTTYITKIPAGHVGVVRSSLQKHGIDCTVTEKATSSEEGSLRVALVPNNCKGIWKSALMPGDYFINRDAMDVTLVDTRVQTWVYKGGFRRRSVALTVGDKGTITQMPSEWDEPFDPKTMADKAISVKVEGWEIPLELRVVVQISPESAPVVVGAVGGMNEVEVRILNPTVRSVVRNVIGGGTIEVVDDGKLVTRPVKALDLISNREILEKKITDIMKIEGKKAGVAVLEVRFGEPAIPPELLIPRQREQLAEQLARAYIEEEKAQTQRRATESARATADKQNEIVAAQIQVSVAEQVKIEKEKLGMAEKAYLTNLAEGQSKQAAVLGQDRVMQLQMADKIMSLLREKPELITGIKWPEVFVAGDGGMNGPAAIFGRALKNGQ